MHQDWYYKLFGEEFGPVPFEGLCDLVRDSHISEDDEIRNGAEGAWQIAGEIIGLFENSEPAEIADLSELEIQFDPSSIPDSPQKTQTDKPAVLQDHEANDEMFYCQVLGQELGPMRLDDLIAMVRDGSLSADDAIKNGLEGSWQPAISNPSVAAVLSTLDPIETLPEQPSAPVLTGKVSPESSASSPPEPVLPEQNIEEEKSEAAVDQAAENKPQQSADEKLEGEMEKFFDKCEEKAKHTSIQMQSLKTNTTKTTNPIPQKPATAKKQAVPEKKEPKPKAASEPSQPAAKPVPKPSKPKKSFSMPSISLPSVSLPSFSSAGGSPSPVVLGIVGVVVLVVIFLTVPLPFGASCQAHVVELNSLLAEFRQLREQGAGEAQWSAFSHKIETDFKPVLDEFVKTANTKSDDDRARRHLLFVLRDHLPKMMVDAKETPSQSEKSCQAALEAASELVGVEPPKMVSVVAKNKPDDVAEENRNSD